MEFYAFTQEFEEEFLQHLEGIVGRDILRLIARYAHNHGEQGKFQFANFEGIVVYENLRAQGRLTRGGMLHLCAWCGKEVSREDWRFRVRIDVYHTRCALRKIHNRLEKNARG